MIVVIEMELTYFQTFRAVALHQSITKAAEELGYAQSSVTTQIQKLEKAYGVQLFERFGRHLRLTSSGEELLKVVGRMLDLYQESKEIVARQAGGTLSIGTIDSLASYYLPPYLQHLRREFPELTIKLQPHKEAMVMEKVKDGELDIGFLLDEKPLDPSLQTVTVREEPLLLIARPDHPLTLLPKVGVQDLNDTVWVLQEESCSYRQSLEKMLKLHNISYRIGFELGNPETVKRCVMSGLGIAILPQIAVKEEIRRGELAALPFSHPEIRLFLQMFVFPKKWMSKPLLSFMDWIMAGKIPDEDPAGFM